MSKEYQQLRLKDFIQFNPKEKLSKGSIARKITMEHIVPYNRYVSSNTFEEYKGGSKFRNGDTIMARITPCLENGKTAYISSLDQNELAFGSTEFIVLREVYGVSDKKYIYYLMSTPEIRNVAIKSMVGSSGRQRVQQNVLENYIVCLPSLNEQIRIANILSSLDDKIELNRRINENLEQQAQALFKSWFVDFEPFKDGKFVDSELGMIPEGWKVCELGNLCDSISITHPCKKGELIFLNTGDIENGFVLTNKYMNIKDMPGQAKKSIKENDILYSEIRPINRHYAFVNFPAHEYIVSTKLMVIRAINEKLAIRLYQYLTSDDIINELQHEAESRSGTFPQIRFENIKRLKILIGPNEIENQYTEFIWNIYKMIFQYRKEIIKLEHIRDTLLPKLMSGELKLSEIETEI